MFSNLVLILTLILASNYARALPQGANLDRLAGDDVIQQDWSDLQYGRFDENELRKRQFWPFCTTATTTITVTVGQAGVVSSTSMTTSIKSTSSSKARTSPTYVPSPSVVPVGTPVRLTTGSSAVASTTTKPVTTTVLWVRPRTFTRFNQWGQVTATVVSTVTDLVTVTTTATSVVTVTPTPGIFNPNLEWALAQLVVSPPATPSGLLTADWYNGSCNASSAQYSAVDITQLNETIVIGELTSVTATSSQTVTSIPYYALCPTYLNYGRSASICQYQIQRTSDTTTQTTLNQLIINFSYSYYASQSVTILCGNETSTFTNSVLVTNGG